LYSKEELTNTLEKYGYIKSDIQKSNVRGDMLNIALLIQIAEKLDKLLEKQNET